MTMQSWKISEFTALFSLSHSRNSIASLTFAPRKSAIPPTMYVHFTRSLLLVTGKTTRQNKLLRFQELQIVNTIHRPYPCKLGQFGPCCMLKFVVLCYWTFLYTAALLLLLQAATALWAVGCDGLTFSKFSLGKSHTPWCQFNFSEMTSNETTMQVTCLHIIVLAVCKHDVAYSLFPAVHFRVVMFTAGCTALSVDTAQRFLLVTFICDRVDGNRGTTAVE